MRPGDVVDDRFELLREAGAGGMGVVFQARDRRDGALVALKVLAAKARDGAARFAREAEVLAALSHPAIVRHVAHGATPEDELYLAMEWLEGEDLAERSARAPLTLGEVISVMTRVADAVGAAHDRGLIHRDLKPSNVFLEGRDPARAKLLDFGLAREVSRPTGLTATGIVLGTVGFLSPEQARGSAAVDARTDVFAMGCMLFECLTGKPAFAGDNVIATLAKLLVEEVPRVRTLRADVPGALDSLVARMLDKTPDARPENGNAVAAALRALSSRDTASTPSLPGSVRAPALTAREQRVMAVILVGQTSDLDAMASATASSANGDATIISLRTPAARNAIAETMRRFDGAAEVAADGTVVVTMRVGGSATDQAAHAARCALALRAVCPGAAIALALGRGVADSGMAAGEVIEHAAALLTTARTGSADGVYVEASLAPLVEARFVVSKGAPTLLHAERNELEVGRVLLGRVTPFVGRTRELMTLEQTLTETVLEPVASVALVIAGAGLGKSRLLEEFLKGARRRHPEALVWFARAEAMREQSAFGVIAALVRSAIGTGDATTPEELRDRLAAHAGEAIADAESAARVVHFLAEILGCPFPDDASVQLRAARQSSVLMRDQIARAFTDLVGAALARRPVLIVLEDLHWADAPSIQLTDAALRAHTHAPLMVLAVGRPETEERFGALFPDRGVQTLRLNPLSPRATAELAKQVLGGGDDEAVTALAARSGGNPFILEELVRARAARGMTEDLPDAVLALVQARLATLDADLRRTLRAASVFGRVSTAGGVAALLGDDERDEAVRASLQTLADREILEPMRDGAAFAFRHDLVREAAYAMLTDQDRATGHALAAEWLERAGEPDAGVLAMHFDRGGDPVRAASHYVRSAEQALDGDDFAAVTSRAARALTLGASGEDFGRAKLAWATAQRWAGNFDGVIEAAVQATEHLPRGSRRWFSALQIASVAADASGRHEEGMDVVTRAVDCEPDSPDAAGMRIAVMAMGATTLSHRGRQVEFARLVERMDREAASLVDADPLVDAWVCRVKTMQVVYVGDFGAALSLWKRAVGCFEAAGDRRAACAARMNLAFTMILLGLHADAVAALRASVDEARALDLRHILAVARHNLGLALARCGALDEALAEETAACDALLANGDGRLLGGARLYMSVILEQAGDLPGAEREARRALGDLEQYPLSRPAALSQLARVLLARHQASEALESASAAFVALGHGPVDEGDAQIRLTHAEALYATGRKAEGDEAIREAAARLLARARLISDESLRAHFLDDVPENATTLRLARALD